MYQINQLLAFRIKILQNYLQPQDATGTAVQSCTAFGLAITRWCLHGLTCERKDINDECIQLISKTYTTLRNAALLNMPGNFPFELKKNFLSLAYVGLEEVFFMLP